MESTFNIGNINTRTDLGDALRKIRISKGLSQQEVANICDLTQTHIMRIETARYSTTIDVISKIANALDAEIIIKAR